MRTRCALSVKISSWIGADSRLGGVLQRDANRSRPGAWRVSQGGVLYSVFTVKKGFVHEKSGVADRVALLPGAFLTGSTVLHKSRSKISYPFNMKQ